MSSTDGSWLPYQQREAALAKLDARIAQDTNAVELRFERACVLAELGRTDAARHAYLELLIRWPRHFGALNNLGLLLHATGFRTAARTAYIEAITHHPDNPIGHLNLAKAFVKNNEPDAARRHYETALRLDPINAEAHQGLAMLAIEAGDMARAQWHREAGFRDRPLALVPYRGAQEPLQLLVLISSMGGTVPIYQHLDDRVFATTILTADFYDPSAPLPPHHLVFNAIGDADLPEDALLAAARLVERTSAPVLNDPRAVLATGRVDNARRLGQLPDVVTPRMALIARRELLAPDAADTLQVQGFAFPLLLRVPGQHTGQNFVRVDTPDALPAALAEWSAPELLVIEFLDARSADGKIRKYRVMLIDGVPYPVHAAIAHDWKIHYFTAEMAEDAEHRAEDEAFLTDMPGVLGDRAMTAIEEIGEQLGLDYAGIDFSLGPQGEVLVFEANAVMVVNPVDADPRWAYRREPIERVRESIRQMLTMRAALADMAFEEG